MGARPARIRRPLARTVVAGATLTVGPPVDSSVSGNRSLDEFADAGAGTDDAPDESVSDAGPESAAGDQSVADGQTEPPAGDDPDSDGVAMPDGDTIARPASTYTWHPDGEPCAACGAAVEERWRDGDDLVCADCKEW